MATAQEITAAIDTYIKSHGGGYAASYVGIAADPRKRLFTDHGVTEEGGAWVHHPAPSSSAAREIEAAFIRAGADGGGGGGDASTTSVSAYKKTASTKPQRR